LKRKTLVLWAYLGLPRKRVLGNPVLEKILKMKGHESFIAHLDATIEFFEQERAQIKSQENLFIYKYESEKLSNAFTRATVVVSRISGHASPYMQEIQSVRASKFNPDVQFEMILGIMRALRFDLEHSYLETLQELAHADLFSNYLDMASYLQTEGYKDAAAVLAGSTLEAHLRQMGHKSGISTVDGASNPKTAGRLNDDLAKADLYGRNEHKQVIAWLAIRNDAAHGDYGKYTGEEVKLVVQGIRDFISRHPA
jgi:hypothetical protein